jgi:hypothetical protein
MHICVGGLPLKKTQFVLSEIKCAKSTEKKVFLSNSKSSILSLLWPSKLLISLPPSPQSLPRHLFHRLLSVQGSKFDEKSLGLLKITFRRFYDSLKINVLIFNLVGPLHFFRIRGPSKRCKNEIKKGQYAYICSMTHHGSHHQSTKEQIPEEEPAGS